MRTNSFAYTLAGVTLAVVYLAVAIHAVSVQDETALDSDLAPHGHYCATWGAVQNLHLDVLTNTTFHISCQILATHVNCPSEGYHYDEKTHDLHLTDYHLGGCLYDALTPFRGLLGDFTFSYSPSDNVIVTHSGFGVNNMTACNGETMI